MKNILVLTDFSVRAEYAAEFAMNLAAHTKGNLWLCHVLEVPKDISHCEERNWKLYDEKNDCLLDLKELGQRLTKSVEVNKDGFKVTINYINDFGQLPEIARRTILEKSVDLVVIGARKSNRFSRFMFSSHTNDMLDRLPCPVLVVPENVQFKGISNITYATDLSFDNVKVVSYLTRLAKPFKALIQVNHISGLNSPDTDSDVTISNQMKANLEPDHSPVAYYTINGESVKKGLRALVACKVDILVLVHRKYTFFKRLIHTSISKQMAENPTVPLLVMPNNFSVDAPLFTDYQLDHFCYENSEIR